ncbi:MAG: DsrE family protein [Sandaracinaceae bacterium]
MLSTPSTSSLRLALLALVVAMTGCVAAPAVQAQPTPGAEAKTIVVHIGQYTNDLHSATMGLSLAGMLQRGGASVTVFLDREGVRMADRTEPLLTYGDSDAEALVTAFLSGGGRVMVCPHCAALSGVAPEALRDGFEMGTMDSIAALFLAADTVIDY